MNNIASLIIILLIVLFFTQNYIYDKIVSSYLKLKLYFGYNEDDYYMHNNFNSIFKNITNINSKNFDINHKINASCNSINQFKIIDMKNKKHLIKNIINHNETNESIFKIINECLKHINVNGKKIDINKCIILDLLSSDVQSFPTIHTDIEWNIFDKSDGFQFWYLYENNEKHGNMYLYEKKDVLPSTYLKYDANSITTYNQCNEKEVKNNTYENNINPNVYYLNMQNGECLIFGKNLYHSSDHVKSKYRYSVNCRIIIADDDGGIPVSENEKCWYNTLVMLRLLRNGIVVKNNKIYCGMFDLMYI